MANEIFSASATTGWDVFLNFCGSDTRFNFTSHLYSALHRLGVRNFMDDEELLLGREEISSQLVEAICKSKTCVVIMSENYAFSTWCLDELVKIVECSKTMGMLIIPLYYRIEPGVVRHQTGCFKYAFEKHEVRFAGDIDKVYKWRAALREVTNFLGYHVTGNRSEADIIDEVIDKILQEIIPMTLDVAKYPVGLDSRVQDTTQLLNSCTEGVTRIGIYGVPGVGKTTLAKALYNHNFSDFGGSCFLADVREFSGTPADLVCLQQQLIDDILKRKGVTVSNVDQGTKLIRERLHSRKVLIILDDLDHRRKLDALVGPFGTGSIIIITTRDEGLLDDLQVKPRNRYMVEKLDHAKSMQLFMEHAFGITKPSDVFVALSEDILPHARGIPLALVVFGSNLANQPEVVWRFFIKKLQQTPDSSIEEKLKISLDALL